ncbi:MAG TPA: SDR family NAD(P)-dependent oxidoreductase, partial [Bacteroidales bacterium]|nr:SDR family NAD(P)-dependent oxidoreductase [Bacteroidales bacterium]
MEKQENILSSLIHLFRDNPEYTSALNESFSFRDDEKLIITAAGRRLNKSENEDIAVLGLQSLEEILENEYSEKSPEEADRLRADLLAASINKKQPGSDVLLHYVFDWPVVVRMFPPLINGVLCAKDAQKETIYRLGDKALFIPWNEPGIKSIRAVEKTLSETRKAVGKIPALLMLQNNGILVGGNTIADVENLLNELFGIFPESENMNDVEMADIPESITEILPALRMMVSQNELYTLKTRNNSLISQFVENPELAERLNEALLPATAGIAANSFLIFTEEKDIPSLAEEINSRIRYHHSQHSVTPAFILLKNYGLISIAENAVHAEKLLDASEDLMRTILLTDNFGGPLPVADPGVQSFEYLSGFKNGRVAGKNIIVTGAAQGFGAGIAEELFVEGANIIIADLNEEKGLEMADKLNRSNKSNQALFVSVNVADEKSVENLILETVKTFGGLDVYISNAGVLRAGGL